jgi:hypothetical protein
MVQLILSKPALSRVSYLQLAAHHLLLVCIASLLTQVGVEGPQCPSISFRSITCGSSPGTGSSTSVLAENEKEKEGPAATFPPIFLVFLLSKVPPSPLPSISTANYDLYCWLKSLLQASCILYSVMSAISCTRASRTMPSRNNFHYQKYQVCNSPLQ